jgi:small-conductance mechanosensitive channel
MKFEDYLQPLIETGMGYLPKLAGALLLLLLGWFIAHLLRIVCIRLIGGLDLLVARIAPGAQKKPWKTGSYEGPLGTLVFWTVMLGFLTAATQVLELTIFGDWLQQLLAYVPLLVGAVLVIVAGVLLSQLARDLVVRAATASGFAHARPLGIATHTITLSLAVIIGLELLGLNTAFVITIASILMAGIALSVALAFGLGAQNQVGNLLAARQLSERYRDGDYIRIGEHEGRIVELTERVVVVENNEGRVSIPASLFTTQACILVIDESSND